MAMIVDEAGRHHRAAGVDGARRRATEFADFDDLAVLDRDIAAEGRHPRAIDDTAIPDQQIVRHWSLSLICPFLFAPVALPARTVAHTPGRCHLVHWPAFGSELTTADSSRCSTHPKARPCPTCPALRAERAALELSIEARQRELGPDHPDLANDLRALGRLAHELGDFQDAQSLLHRALALYTESVGAEHPETATTINHIGLVLHDLGDLDAAAAAFERALALDEQALGRDHVNVARDCNNLAACMRDMGDRFAAKEALDWALSVYMAQLGPDHPTTKSVKRNRSLLG